MQLTMGDLLLTTSLGNVILLGCSAIKVTSLKLGWLWDPRLIDCSALWGGRAARFGLLASLIATVHSLPVILILKWCLISLRLCQLAVMSVVIQVLIHEHIIVAFLFVGVRVWGAPWRIRVAMPTCRLCNGRTVSWSYATHLLRFFVFF